jgi:hypothetical protein
MSRSRVATVAAAGVLAAIAFAPGSAVAGPHFLSATGGIDANTGDYTATFKEAGLGNTPITYDLSATTQYTFQCFTKSNNNPQGSPNSGGPSNESTQTTLTPRNGQIKGSLTIDVTFPPTSVSCKGGGLKLCLTAASYTNVSLVDTTDNVAATLPDGGIAAPSGSFIACSD